MKQVITSAISLLLCVSQSMAAVHSFYIGCAGRDRKGIYVADFDDANGALSNLRLATSHHAPSFLGIHPEKKILYSVCAGPEGAGTLAAFAADSNQNLTLLSEVSSGGKGPCHLAIHPSGRVIAVANYHGGSISSFLLDDQGIPAPLASLMQQESKSVRPARQADPRAHGVHFFENTLFVADAGIDQIRAYTIDLATAQLTPSTQAHTIADSGDAPRHLAIHPTRPWVYAVNEHSNTVTFYQSDAYALTKKQSITTLPADFQSKSKTAEIEIHPNGKFLYASNRGHDSIACYQIDSTSGELTELGQTLALVKRPRHFTIAPGGAFLIVAGQDSQNLHTLAIDPQSGKLTPTHETLSVPTPICLLFSKQ